MNGARSLQRAKDVLRLEAEAVRRLIPRVNRSFARAVELLPGDPEVLFDLAIAQRSADRGEKAVGTMRSALQIAPKGWSRRDRAEQLLREWK